MARVLLWPVAAALLLLASIHVHLPTAMGRAAAEDAINQVATGSLPGRLHVDSVDELDLRHVAITGFEAYDLDGTKVISAAHGSMRMDPWAVLTDGVLRIRDLQGYDGSIVIRPGRHHKVSIEDVFSTGDGGKKKIDLDLGWLWAENIRLAIRMIDRPLVFRIATASVNIERFGQGPVDVNLRQVNATMVEPAPLDVDIRMVAANGRIRPQTEEVVNIDAGVCLGDVALQVRIVFHPGPPKVARVIVDYENGLGFLASLGLRIGDLFSGPLEVDERELSGEPPECEGPSPQVSEEESSENTGAGDLSAHPAAGDDGELTDEELEDWNDAVDERLEDADENAEEALEAAGEGG